MIFCADVVAALAALLFAFLIRNDFNLAAFADSLSPLELLMFAAIAAGVFALTGLNSRIWRFTGLIDLLAIARAASFIVLGFLAAAFLSDRLAGVPRSVPLILWFTLVTALMAPRLAYAWLAQREQRIAASHIRRTPVLLVGAGEATAIFVRALARRPNAQLEILGILEDFPGTAGRSVNGVPVLGRLDQLGSVVDRLAVHGHHPERIYLSIPARNMNASQLRKLQAEADRRRLTVDALPSLDVLIAQADAGRVGPDAVSIRASAPAVRLLDFVLASLGLLVAAPLMALIALAILVRLGRPVLFVQSRQGRNLVPFRLVKFRSMVDAISADGRVLADSERLTGLGRLLRRSRIDELPQLWNVLTGEMSLVGPRPLLAHELAVLPDQGAERNSVRPGITGWAQVCGGHRISTEVKEALDLWAVRNASIALYVRILVRTVQTVLFGERIDHAAIALAYAGAPPDRIERELPTEPVAASGRRRKIVCVNRYYWPDHSATSRMLIDLAEHLAQHPEVEIEVVTSRLRYVEGEAEYPSLDHRNGVRIHRIWTTSFGRSNLLGRGLDYLSFYPSAFVRLLVLLRRGDTVIAKTDPPLISVPAWLAARARHAELVCWCQDLFPEVAEALGVRLAGGPTGAFLRKLRNLSLRRAKVVAICDAMADRIAAQGVPRDRIMVIHNWADGEKLFPLPEEIRRQTRARLGIADAHHVLMYSGNLGRAHAVPLLVEMLHQLRDAPGLVVLIVGDGAGHTTLRRESDARGWTHLRFLPYQPEELLNESLNVADVHIVSLDPACEGLIMPSKIYAALAVGRPILAVGDADGAVATLVRSLDAGNVASQLVADTKLAPTVADRAAWPAVGEVHAVFDAEFARERALGEWDKIVDMRGTSTATKIPERVWSHALD